MNPLIITYALNGMLMIAMPAGLAVFLIHRWKLNWSICWIGAATFVISQIAHIPFNWGIGQLIINSGVPTWSRNSQVLLQAAFLGISAALFEEGARYLVLRFWARNSRSWRNGVIFGVGHGGVEALILGILNLINYTAWMIMRDPTAVNSLAASGIIPVDQVQVIKVGMAAVWDVPWYYSMLGAAERFLTIPCQIFMAVLVMQVFTRKQISWLFLAFAFHALFDFSAVLGVQYLNVYWVEAIIACYTILSIVLIFALRQEEPQPKFQDQNPYIPITPPMKVLPIEETSINLDSTRFEDK